MDLVTSFIYENDYSNTLEHSFDNYSYRYLYRNGYVD